MHEQDFCGAVVGQLRPILDAGVVSSTRLVLLVPISTSESDSALQNMYGLRLTPDTAVPGYPVPGIFPTTPRELPGTLPGPLETRAYAHRGGPKLKTCTGASLRKQKTKKARDEKRRGRGHKISSQY